MTNAPGTGNRGTDGGMNAEPLFPSEGTFSAVVPLSQIDGTDDVPAEEVARGAAEENAVEGNEDEDEATLVPSRLTHARAASHVSLRATPRGDSGANRAADLRPKGGGQPWLVTAAVLLISIIAGATAGAYLIGSRNTQDAGRQPAPAEVAAPSDNVAAEVTRPAPPAAAPTPGPAAHEAVGTNEGGETSAKASAEREAAPAPKPAPDAAHEETRAPEPAPRRVTAAEPRAGRPTRAEADAAETRPAPKPARRPDAEPRPRETVAAKRAPAAARTLPVSAPPASAKSKKVIQWP